MALALTGARIFDGEHFLDDHAVVIDGPSIVGLVPVDEVGLHQRMELDGGLLCPGFIDVQVNGGGGALLNASPDAATVRRIAGAHRRFGTTGLLPTVITGAPEVMRSAIAAVRQAKAGGLAEVLGIHIEGPFIDVARKGAHDQRFIRELTEMDVDEITSTDCGAVMLTLAPNRVSPELIRRLSEGGVLVSLGHAEASCEEARAALAAGARSFTHLYNAMSQLNGRAPGMVGAALADAESFVGIIADGHHVDDAALRVAFAAKNPDRMMLVSDAMPPAAGGPDRFELQGRVIIRKDGRLQLEEGVLAGSSLTMGEAVRYCVGLGLELGRVLRMASLVPAMFLKRDNELGRIAPGYLASLVYLDDGLQVKRTWVEGR